MAEAKWCETPAQAVEVLLYLRQRDVEMYAACLRILERRWVRRPEVCEGGTEAAPPAPPAAA